LLWSHDSLTGASSGDGGLTGLHCVCFCSSFTPPTWRGNPVREEMLKEEKPKQPKKFFFSPFGIPYKKKKKKKRKRPIWVSSQLPPL
jgi:hypothetical protein